MKNRFINIKNFFIWIFTGIGLVLLIIGTIGLINLGLRTWVFTKADYNYCPTVPVSPMSKVLRVDSQCEDQKTSQKQRDAAQGIAFVITGFPTFLFFYKRTI